MAGVFSRVCKRLDIPYFSCRGYTSQSEMWVAAQRLIDHCREGQEPIVLHFGDHDPSGIDMTRDITDRIELFMSQAGYDMKVERLALNMDQVEQYAPPPNPAKVTDARFIQYQKIHGDESWELDALEPTVLASLVEDSVAEYVDEDLMSEMQSLQDEGRRKLTAVSNKWDKLTAKL